MVRLKIDDKYWLWSDSRQWIVGTRRERIKKDKLKSDGKGEVFTTSLSGALKAYYDLSLRLSKATTWEQLINDSRAIKARIERILKKIEIQLKVM